jgi:FkbM family methyltransferase
MFRVVDRRGSERSKPKTQATRPLISRASRLGLEAKLCVADNPLMIPDSLVPKRVRLDGHGRTLYAEAGDPFLARFGSGKRYAAFGSFCAQYLRADDTFLDIGANIGVTSIIASRHLTNGRILAVEASPRNGEALRRNIAVNGVARADVEICAVGAESGAQAFHEASAYGFVMTAKSLLSGHPTRSVPVKTVDQLVREHRLDRVDAIKLDIEGFEWEALRGAERTLQRHDPIVFLEFNSWCQIAFYDRNPRAFLEFLLDTFPQLYLWKDCRLVSVRELGAVGFLRENLIEGRCISDLVAARQSPRLDLPESAPEVGPFRRLLQRLKR